MVKQSSVLEIEVDTPTNANLVFLPIGGKKVRGRFDWRRVREPLAAMAAARWPAGGVIPGQRIGVDPESGAAWIVDPLHDAEHAAVREKILAQGNRLPPARQDFPGADVPTWLFWIKRCVEAGVAKIVQGVLPAKIEGEPKKSFFGNPTPDARDKTIAALVEVVAKLLPPTERQDLLAKLQS